MPQVQEKRLEAAREEEKMLEARRELEEQEGPGADKDLVKNSKARVDATAKDQVRFHPATSCHLFSFFALLSAGWKCFDTRFLWLVVV